MSNKSVALEKVRFMRYKPIPVMKTEFSLWSFSHKEKPVFITENPVLIAGIPVMKTGFSLWEKLHREKEAITLYQNKSEILYNVGILTSCCTVFWIAFMNFWNGISDLIFLINTFFLQSKLDFQKKILPQPWRLCGAENIEYSGSLFHPDSCSVWNLLVFVHCGTVWRVATLQHWWCRKLSSHIYSAASRQHQEPSIINFSRGWRIRPQFFSHEDTS